MKCSNQFLILLRCLALLSLASAPTTGQAAGDGRAAEPDLETAKGWWPDLTDYWTPVGWKHHRFRYNVFFDGTLYADPSLSQTARQWEGQGVQVRFAVYPAKSTSLPEKMRSERYALEDDRSALQGWTDSAAPVLGTEWSKDAVLFRQHTFAHVPEGAPVKTGLEPLFAWVRLSVHERAPALTPPDRFTFCLQLNAPHVRTSMYMRSNIRTLAERARYPRVLAADRPAYDQSGFRLVEPDGKVRLGVAGAAQAEVGFLEGDNEKKDPLLVITVDAQPGRHVDVLIPMVPTEREIFGRELALGYDAALAQANRFWQARPATAATIDVPEEYIGETIRQFERFAEVLSERVPETGKNITLSGSLAYVKIWATPTGKMVSMFLDPLGYHDLAGEYLEPFIDAQGTRKPPSNFLQIHPGYLGSPAVFKSIDWMADHGSLLFAIANHALLIGDAEAKRRYVEPIVKACEFIQHARRVTGHGGVDGILPPARSSDAPQLSQGVWNDGWCYKGLVTSARFLRQVNHARAQEFLAEANEYQRTFVAAFRAAAAQAPTWRDGDGTTHPLLPTSLHGAVEESLLMPHSLDTGVLFLVFSGLFPADDPLMKSAIKWFRDGPVRAFGRRDSNFRQVPYLRHEMSSFIPGYSWNVFHNHQLGNRQHYLEGMYSQYAGAISRQTRTVCETRGGITGRITHADTPFYLARLAVVDDLIASNELHLLRLCPLAWVKPEKQSRFEKLPTAFGPVTLSWRLSDDSATLQVEYSAELHAKPDKIVLHVPPMPGLKALVVNGARRAVQPGTKVEL